MRVTSAVLRTTVAALGVGLAAVAWSPTASAAAAACTPDDLTAKVTGTAAGMSQPSTFITVTKTSGGSCWVKGYPTITRAWTKNGKKAITVTDGAVQNAPTTKVKKLVLAPGQKAWFAIGTATAYDPPLVTLTKVAFSPVAGTSVSDSDKVAISMQATAPSGKPIPVGVTAFARGTGTGD